MNTKLSLLQKSFIIIAFCFSALINAQGQANSYRIYLTDKNDSPYSIETPSEYLSQRAIDKRERFNIAITEEDFPVNPSYTSTILSCSNEIQLLSTSKWFNTITIYCPNSAVLQTIQDLDIVREIVPVAYYDISKSAAIAKTTEQTPNNSKSILKNTTVEYNYSHGEYVMYMHRGNLLHRAGFAGEGMLIAVLDAGWTGFDDAPFFQHVYEEGRVLGTRDLVPFNSDGSVYAASNHGTLVASVMSPAVNGSFVGTAPQASYFFIRSEDIRTEQPIEEDFWAQAAEIADSIGADVINSSLGYTTFHNFNEKEWTYADNDGVSSIASLAATKAVEKGIIVCSSAGNEGNKEWQFVSRPADAFNILSVGAVDWDSIKTPFSSIGPSYDGRIKPDVSSLGGATPAISIGGDYIHVDGTSFSSPVVAGLSTCLWQALPNKSASEVIQIIRESGHQANNPDYILGYGIPDFYKAYLSEIGIKEYTTRQQINVFPNPCETYCCITNTDISIREIILYDITGRVVKHHQVNQESIIKIDLSDLGSGTYIGKAKLKNGEGYFKIIKTK